MMRLHTGEVSVTGQIVANGMGIQQMGNQVSGYLEREEVFFENITIKQHLLCQVRKILETYHNV